MQSCTTLKSSFIFLVTPIQLFIVEIKDQSSSTAKKKKQGLSFKQLASRSEFLNLFKLNFLQKNIYCKSLEIIGLLYNAEIIQIFFSASSKGWEDKKKKHTKNASKFLNFFNLLFRKPESLINFLRKLLLPKFTKLISDLKQRYWYAQFNLIFHILIRSH